jgi:hypothetical protein
MRGLLEVWAHLYWVYNGGDETTWECRGIRVELMLAHENLATAKGLTKENLEELGDLELVEKRQDSVDLYREMALSKGCANAIPRKRTGAAASLREISKQPGMSWVMPMWSNSSLVLHPLSVEWLFHDMGDGRSALVTAPLSQLAVRLGHALSTYTHLSEYFLLLIGQDKLPKAMLESVGTFMDSEFYTEAANGKYDADLPHRLGD